jgi:DNA mismatch repair protein MutS2
MVPADAAALPVFESVFIDIGDRQSIPDRLSTFSARIRTIAEMASLLRNPCLVLLDEIGTGTDPEDGVALAIAIVDYFRARGATLIATTHLEAMKAYAAETEGCANAAMQFDEATFTPTFRMLAGIPGRSGGLEIAERLGLPAPILQQARERRGQSGRMVAAYLARLEQMCVDLEERLRAAGEERRRLDEERLALETSSREREERQRRALASEIELALRAMREEGERYLATLQDRELAARLRRQESKAGDRLRAEARRLIRGVSGASSNALQRREIETGMTVTVPGMGVRGTVESAQGERVVLRVLGKRLTVRWDECRPDAGAPSARDERGPRLPPGVRLERRPAGEEAGEIHLRGLTAEEALARVDKYLDDAYLSGLSPVRLVHGVGTGRLQRAVSELLARHPHVEAFERAPADQGGAGVTVVHLRL